MATYDEFRQRFLEANSWPDRKDGPPLEILDELSHEDRRRAESELLQHLDLRDTWPIIALGHLRSKESLPRLYDLLGQAKGDQKAETALAIWKIAADEHMLDVLLELSRSECLTPWWPIAHEMALINVIHCLAQLPSPAARTRLEELTSDPEYLVAYNAGYALKLRKTHHGIKS